MDFEDQSSRKDRTPPLFLRVRAKGLRPKRDDVAYTFFKHPLGRLFSQSLSFTMFKYSYQLLPERWIHPVGTLALAGILIILSGVFFSVIVVYYV